MTIKYNGLTYKSQVELAKAFNVNYNTFRTRLYQGYTVDEALSDRESFKRLRNKDKIIGIDGKTFNNVTDFMHFYGINKKRAEEILKGNLDINNLDDSNNGWKSIDVIIEGKKYYSWKEVVNDYPNNDLNESLLSKRYRLGKRGVELIAPKKHINRDQYKTNISVTIDNHNFMSLGEASRFYDFDYVVLKKRYKRGIRGSDLIKPYKKRSNKINKFQNKG